MLSPIALTFVAIACAIVAVILALGLGQMGRGGIEGAKRSNKLMQYRILAQLATVILVVIIVALNKSGG